MPSPFPGMNPYIEQDAFWQDFHLEFLPAIRKGLVAQVRPKYIVMLDRGFYLCQPARTSALLKGCRLGAVVCYSIQSVPSARSRLNAALIKARWVNACG